ncbi:hypothetical protein [Consotaella salsifontis]|uniref:hypothetical protein n=1 Tax=Consotaella salsifontis TaxID=1365950 RepID=UPI001A962099|nr:hypothetical protein [Consotaella salsifontis]
MIADAGFLAEPADGPAHLGISPVCVGAGLEAPMLVCCARMLKAAEPGKSVAILDRSGAPFAVLSRLDIVALAFLPFRALHPQELKGIADDRFRLSIGFVPAVAAKAERGADAGPDRPLVLKRGLLPVAQNTHCALDSVLPLIAPEDRIGLLAGERDWSQ